MKSVHEALDQILPEIIAMSEDIYCHPELGFKEFRTRKKAIEALDKAGIPHEDVAYTGIRAVLDSGKPGPNIGLITEFDAVPTFGHPYASEDSCAAHTCGHYGQLGVMMSLFLAIRESGMLKDLCGKVTLLVTPAEEFCDMDYRKGLIKEAGVSLLAFEVYAFYIKSVARSFYSQLLLLWIPMRTKFPLCFLSAFFLMLFLIPFI